MRISKYLLLILLVMTVLILSMPPENGFAQTQTVTSFERISDQYKAVGEEYITKLKDYAFAIFKIFILVDIGIFGLRAALNRSELSEIISQFLMMLVFATFCAVAIKYYPDWTGFLLDKSRNIAGAVNGGIVEFTPINTGWEILLRIIKATPKLFITAGSAVKAMCFLILGGVIQICFCLMGASMLVVLCESYIAMSAAILLLGFGGSSMTKDYAINTMRYAVSVAFKLFVIRLVMGVGMSIVNELTKFDKVTFQDLFPILIAAVILLVLVRSLPETVAGIINGSHTGSGVGLGAVVRGAAVVAATAATAGAGAVAGAASAARTVSAAQKIASISGHGGSSGTFGQLANAFSAARQQTGGYGGLKGTLRQTASNISNMHSAQEAMKTPNQQGGNPYINNPYMSPLSNRQPASGQHSSQAESTSAETSTANSSGGSGSSQAFSPPDNPYMSPLSNRRPSSVQQYSNSGAQANTDTQRQGSRRKEPAPRVVKKTP